ncbi:hypothetical protein B0H21DRAFT_515547 [Amylocystis lapponica]|nr:hypothetical protein B0H21DRAFT_515547 [Amylocystis lapponica]
MRPEHDRTFFSLIWDLPFCLIDEWMVGWFGDRFIDSCPIQSSRSTIRYGRVATRTYSPPRGSISLSPVMDTDAELWMVFTASLFFWQVAVSRSHNHQPQSRSLWRHLPSRDHVEITVPRWLPAGLPSVYRTSAPCCCDFKLQAQASTFNDTYCHSVFWDRRTACIRKWLSLRPLMLLFMASRSPLPDMTRSPHKAYKACPFAIDAPASHRRDSIAPLDLLPDVPRQIRISRIHPAFDLLVTSCTSRRQRRGAP